jgi:hypothetical protein
MAQIKESTAYVRVFYMGEEELQVAVALSKAGSAFDDADGDVSEIEAGWYKIELTAADTDTVGDLAFRCTAPGFATSFVDQVMPNPGDDPWAVELPGSYSAGTAGHILGARLDTEVSSRSSHEPADIWDVTERTLTEYGTLAADVWDVAERSLTDKEDFELSESAILAVWEQAAAGLTEAGTVGRLMVDRFEAVLTRLGEPEGASVVADIAAVQDAADAVLAVLGQPGHDTIAGDIAELRASLDGGVELTASAAADVADALLGRSIAGGASGGRTVGSALAAIRNKILISGGVLTIYDTDDTTVLYLAAVSSAPGDPITGIDPV